MKSSEADREYGKVVYRDDHVAIRVKTTDNGETHVVAHVVTSAGEQLPRGYVLGSNLLIHNGRQSKRN